MAITYRTPGATAYSAAGGASVAPAYPASIAAGDLLIMIVGLKPSAANSGVVSTPSGWSDIGAGQVTGGGYGATLGADTGNTTIAAFSKTAAGGESGTVSVSLTNNNVTWAKIFRLSGSGVWSVAAAFADDSSAGNVSLAFPANPGVTANDFILAGMCIPTDVTTPSQFSAEALSQASVTFGTVTEIGELDSATGNDIGGFLVRAPVNAGTATGNPTLTATAGGTTTNVRGPGVFIRIREVISPTATMAPTEAADTAAASVTLGRKATMAPSEAADSTNVPATKWDPAQADADLTLSGGDAVATATTAFAQGNLRSVTSYNGGEKVYFECDVIYGVIGYALVGVANASQALDADPVSANAITYRGDDGNIWTNNAGTDYGSTWTTQRIGVALDVAGPTMYVRRAGVWQGGGDPVAGTGGVAVGFAGPYFATAGFTFPDPIFQVTIYTDAAEFADPPPTGYAPWSSALETGVTVTPFIGGLLTVLGAVEGADTPDMAAQRGHPASLVAAEGADIAALAVQRGHPLALNGAEGGDTAAMSAKRGHPAILTVTEGSDVAAASVTNGTAKVATLTVIEGGDTSAVSVSVSGAPASGSDYLQRRRRRRA